MTASQKKTLGAADIEQIFCKLHREDGTKTLEEMHRIIKRFGTRQNARRIEEGM